jgi:hypothetical protein
VDNPAKGRGVAVGLADIATVAKDRLKRLLKCIVGLLCHGHRVGFNPYRET